MFKTIVSGTDGRRGRGAAALAQALAAATGARLLLVGVSRDSPRPLDEPSADSLRLEAALREIRDDLAPDARTEIIHGMSPALALRKAAEDAGADLIVVGSRNRTRLQRLASADNAMQVLHDDPCAVAIAPDHLAPCRTLKRIGVGLDDSPESIAALDMALELARPAGAEVYLLAVASESFAGSPNLAPGSSYVDEYRQVIEGRVHEAQAAVSAAVRRCDGVRTRTDVRTGDPAGELVRLSVDCDLLVLGSRRRGPLRRLALGSTAERVIAEAQCPVLVPPRGSTAKHHEARPAARAGAAD